MARLKELDRLSKEIRSRGVTAAIVRKAAESGEYFGVCGPLSAACRARDAGRRARVAGRDNHSNPSHLRERSTGINFAISPAGG